MKTKNVSTGRKAIYLIGVVLLTIGIIIFISTLITGVINSGNFENFSTRTQSIGLMSILGMGLVLIGGLLMSAGRRGIAGSGLILDTEQERKDLEPISRMMGGQVNDALKEANLKEHLPTNQAAPLIKVRCPSCAHLNEEKNKYCGNCGSQI